VQLLLLLAADSPAPRFFPLHLACRWAFPGWVGNDPQTGVPSGSPFTFPNQTSRYLMEWVKGAKSAYDLDIDYVGVWNERASDSSYVVVVAVVSRRPIRGVGRDDGNDFSRWSALWKRTTA
jgi:hypothetical protein